MDTSYIEHAGIVRRTDDRFAYVEIATSGCSSCQQLKGCGVGKISAKESVVEVKVLYEPWIKVGQEVNLQMPEKGIWPTVLLGYLLPTAFVLIGAAVGNDSGHGDKGVALGALLGFFISYVLIKLLIKINPHLLPSMAIALPRGR